MSVNDDAVALEEAVKARLPIKTKGMAAMKILSSRIVHTVSAMVY